MMEYKKTTEYVFDLLENAYKKHYDSIHLIGVDHILVCIPLKLKENLKATYTMYFPTTGEYKLETYPIKYKNMNIVYLDVDNIMFILKGEEYVKNK